MEYFATVEAQHFYSDFALSLNDILRTISIFAVVLGYVFCIIRFLVRRLAVSDVRTSIQLVGILMAR